MMPSPSTFPCPHSGTASSGGRADPALGGFGEGVADEFQRVLNIRKAWSLLAPAWGSAGHTDLFD
jgi:hypothetical protein